MALVPYDIDIGESGIGPENLDCHGPSLTIALEMDLPASKPLRTAPKKILLIVEKRKQKK